MQSRSDAPQALESPEACTEQEPTKKGKKKKEKPQQSLESEGANGVPGAVAAEGGGVVACGPGESEKKVPSENSENPPESALIGTRTAGPGEIDDVTLTVPSEHPLESGAAGTSSDGESESVTLTVPSEQLPESGPPLLDMGKVNTPQNPRFLVPVLVGLQSRTSRSRTKSSGSFR